MREERADLIGRWIIGSLQGAERWTRWTQALATSGHIRRWPRCEVGKWWVSAQHPFQFPVACGLKERMARELKVIWGSRMSSGFPPKPQERRFSTDVWYTNTKEAGGWS